MKAALGFAALCILLVGATGRDQRIAQHNVHGTGSSFDHFNGRTTT